MLCEDAFEEAMKANEKKKCTVKGCTSRRYGLRVKCKAHIESFAESLRQRNMARKEQFLVANPEASYPMDEKSRKWRTMAMSTVSKAVSIGLLPKLSAGRYKCTDCPELATCYDHRDYSRPLMVEPVCAKCNAKRGPAKYPNFEFAKFEMLLDKSYGED